MTPYLFSANTGFLWPDLPFLDKIAAAKRAGFGAVEFHDEPLRHDPAAVRAALEAAGLPALAMNVRMGETLGCAAIPEMMFTAREDIELAVQVANQIGIGTLHILAGKTTHPDARKTLVGNLKSTLDKCDLNILIEPICHARAPNYYLNKVALAADIVNEVANPRLSIMFDCYHVAMEEGAVQPAFDAHKDQIGHIQIAAIQDRAEPDTRGPDYAALLPHFVRHGYTGAFGCEYHPTAPADTAMTWRADLMDEIAKRNTTKKE